MSRVARFILAVYRWAGKMPADAARLRNLDRVAGRLAERENVGAAA
jgi:hypothetical protein